MGDHEVKVSDALKGLISEAGGVGCLITPRGWPHMGLVIVDAVFSLQADYDTVVKPLLARYCRSAPDLDWLTATEKGRPEHDGQSLVNFLELMTLEERYLILNRQVGPGTAKKGGQGLAKAEIVVRVAKNLVSHGVVTRADFVAASVTRPEIEWAVRRVPGVGYACWKYMLNLGGVEVSKPDTMILRWLHEVTREHLDPVAAAGLVENVTASLRRGGLEVTVRQIDHLIWRRASGRNLSAFKSSAIEVAH